MTDEINKYEEEKLKAEIDLLKSEKAKIDLERSTLNKENEKPWYRKERVIQAFFAGVVAVPLLWFFFQEIVTPLYQKENIKLAYENEVARIENERLKDSLDFFYIEIKRQDSLAKLERENAWDNFQRKEKEFEEQKKKLESQYQEVVEKLRSNSTAGTPASVNEVENLQMEISKISEPPQKFTSALRIDERFILQGEGVRYQESPNSSGNFSKGYPDALVFHFTGGENLKASADFYLKTNARASSHIIIGRNGEVMQLVPFNKIAWHAGRSEYNGRTGYNDYAVAIDFVNAGMLEKNGNDFRSWFGKTYDANEVKEAIHRYGKASQYWHTYTNEQIKRAEQICRLLVNKFEIKEILGHSDLAPERHRDPGPAFPLESFQEKFLKN